MTYTGPFYVNLHFIKTGQTMKKHLLIPVSAILVMGTANAQNKINLPVKDKSIQNKAVKTSKFEGIAEQLYGTTTAKPASAISNRAVTLFTVGTSTYQLQTNNAIQNRIVNNADGTISASFTFSNAGGTWTDRGTGYIYHDGTTWSAAPTSRIEPVRTGWPSLIVMGDNSERVITHNTDGKNVHYSNRATKGTGSWSHSATALASTAPEGNYWPRAVAGGPSNGSLHVISISNPVDAASNPVYFNGQQGCLTYCRSLDGGTTWDILHSVPSQHNSSQYSGFRADAYAIDARGNTIAYVVGGPTNDVFLMKSTDNGTTWTKTIINSFPIPLFVDQLTDINGDSVIDTLDTNDGNVALIIDENDDVHVWYGNMRILNDDSTDAQYSYFPGTAGLMYWNENMGASPAVMIAGLEDTDGDMVISVTDWGSYGNSLTSMPSVGIDELNTLHLTYSGLVELTDFGNGKSYRNVYHMSSSDHGTTWSAPVKVNEDLFLEQVFCSVARRAESSCVKMIYQTDIGPGHGVQSTSADFADNSGVTTEQVYACYSPITGTAEVTAASEMVSLFPNPANAAITVTAVNAIEKIEMFNAMGALVISTTPNALNAPINITTLNSGVYMVKIYNGGKVATRKFVKE